jgi:hypothetical protein
LLKLEELPVFLIDDDSIAKWWAAAEMPDEELTKRKILRDWIIKEMKSNGGRFLHCAASAAESEAVSFSQISDGDAKNAVLNKLRQQKSLNGKKRSQADREDVFSADCGFEERLMLLQVLEVACRGVNLVMRLLNQKNASWNV